MQDSNKIPEAIATVAAKWAAHVLAYKEYQPELQKTELELLQLQRVLDEQMARVERIRERLKTEPDSQDKQATAAEVMEIEQSIQRSRARLIGIWQRHYKLAARVEHLLQEW